MKIALAGNPNSGKTTLFNSLTGMNQYVGNWPGVTVEKKEGIIRYDGIDNEIIVTDLPGVYSLSPYTLEEVITRNYLINEKPDVIINIIDGTNLERNLYLTTQLFELNIPIVIAINMMDIVRKNGDYINTKRLSSVLNNVPVIEISAINETGIDDLISASIKEAKFIHIEKPILYDTRLEYSLSKISRQLNRIMPDDNLRFYSIKLFEKDPKIYETIKHNNIPNIKNIISSTETIFDDDSESIIINERYLFVSHIIKRCYIKESDSSPSISERIDNILTNKYLAIPIFILIMCGIYYLSISGIGEYLSSFLNEKFFGKGFDLFGLWIPSFPILIESFLDIFSPDYWMKSLIIDGIVSGVGAVLSFVPQLMILFACLAFLEGCGYMSRVAFIMDAVFRKFGLSGKSFIPILIGTGCTVPAIMAARTIENPSDRKITIITTSFIPCGAKLPMISMFAGALFGGGYWLSISAYILGIFAIIISAIILKKLRIFKKDETPFIMEIPPYRMPRLIDVFKSVWNRTSSFIKKAGTIILLSTILIWVLSNIGLMNGRLIMVNNISDGLLAWLGKKIAWIFSPLGFGNWESTVAVFTGIVAKENIVSTLAVLLKFGETGLGNKEILAQHFGSLSAMSFIIFNLLCAPCFATIATIAKELNEKKLTLFAILYQTIFAYIVSFIVYNFGSFVVYGRISKISVFTLVIVLIIGLFLVGRNRNNQNNIR